MASIEWLEQELSTIDAAVILVAHDRWFLESVSTAVLELEGGRSVFFPGQWHVWRQEKAARLLNQAKWAERQAEDIARLERFVARFRYGTKSRQAQAKLKQIARIEKVRVEAPRARTAHARLRVPEARAQRPHGARGGGLRPRRRHEAAARRRRARARARRARRADRAERLGQDDAARGDRRGPRSAGSATASSSRTSRSTRSSSTSAAACSSARWARPGCSGRRRRRCSGASSSRAGTRTRSRSSRSPAASGAGSRSRSSSPPARTSSSSTSRRTTSTSRAASRSRRRSRRSRATVLLVSHDRAVLDAVAERIVAVEDGTLRSYPGGWADYVRIRAGEDAPPARAPRRRQSSHRRRRSPHQCRRSRPPPSELERIESSIEQREAELAELERKLAEDWGDADTRRRAPGRARRPEEPARPLGRALRRGAGLTV